MTVACGTHLVFHLVLVPHATSYLLLPLGSFQRVDRCRRVYKSQRISAACCMRHEVHESQNSFINDDNNSPDYETIKSPTIKILELEVKKIFYLLIVCNY